VNLIPKQVKSDAGRSWKAAKDDDEDGFEDLPPKIDKAALYSQVLAFMRPGETLTRTLKRLQPCQKSEAERRRERWQAKKQAKKDAEEEAKKKYEETEPESDLVALTGLVDRLVDAGEFEIYGATFEKLRFLLAQQPQPNSAPPTLARDALDIFADDDGDRKPSSAATKPDPATKAESPGACCFVVCSGQTEWLAF